MSAYRLFFIFNLIQGISLCNIRMCLAWSVDEKILTFTCKVNRLQFRVELVNQYHITQGYCLHPFPSPYCYTYYRNSTITQNTYTNETYLIVKGLINNSINGQWSCHHGTNIDVAFVNVTVLTSKETKYSVAVAAVAYECLLWTIIPFIITIICSREILWIVEYRQERRRNGVWFVAFCSFAFITRLCNENYVLYVLLFLKFVLMIACGILLVSVPLLTGTVDKEGKCTGFSSFILSMAGIITGVIMILLLVSKGNYLQRTKSLTEHSIPIHEEIEL